MHFFKNANYKIIENRKIGYTLSLILISVSIISLILHGGPRYNIDFTGGTLVHLRFDSDVEIQNIRSMLAERGGCKV